MLTFAHRGIYDNQNIYENTFSSFNKALQQNIAIELDVRLTKDNIVVVFHDKTLKRLLHVKKTVSKMTYEELYSYTLGNDKIPKLEDVLNLIAGKVHLLLEIKNTNHNQKLCESVMKIMKCYKGTYWIQTFSPFIVYWFKKHHSDIKRGLLLMPYRRYPSKGFGLVMRSMILHCFIKPDFYSYEKSLGKNKLTKFLLEFFAKEYAVWTLNENEESKLKNFDYKIMKYSL